MTASRPSDPDNPTTLGAAATPRRGIGRRGVLTRDTVPAAGIAVIDEEGLQTLSMRKVTDPFGMEAMSLSNYVTGREDLLDGIVEIVSDDLYGDPDVHLDADDWQDYPTRLAHGIRRVALAHPQVCPLIATRPPAAPWIKPPLRILRWIESMLHALQGNGFRPASSVAAHREFSSFPLGHLLLEVSTRGAHASPIDQEPPGKSAAADLTGYPLLHRLEAELTEDHAAEEFDTSLTSLLDRLRHTENRSN